MVTIGGGLLHNIGAFGAIKNHGATAFGDTLLKQQKLANRRVIDDGLRRASGIFLGDFVERAACNTVASVSSGYALVANDR